MFRLSEMIRALTGKEIQGNDCNFSEAVRDSHEAAVGTLFVAIPGERTDGHKFIPDAFANGARAALIQEDVAGDFRVIDLRGGAGERIDISDSGPVCFRVENTISALQKIAAYHRRQLPQMEVLGITGSVGKTSTKELIYDVLSCHYRTLKTPGNMNNEIGLPLTMLKADEITEQAVLEMGFYVPGEIDQLCQIAAPSVGVITNVGMVHASRAGSMEVIARGKSELVQALPSDGTAILNYDDPYVRPMAEVTKAKVFYYGTDPAADLYVSDVESFGLEGVRFVLNYHGEKHAAKIPLIGQHSTLTALRAAAVGLVKGLSWDEILSGLEHGQNQIRMRITKTIRGGMLIDDSYNSSPDAAVAALNLLSEMKGRKVAVMGDMLELGQYEKKGHETVGSRAGQVCDVLVAVGPLSKYMCDAAIEKGLDPGKVFRFETAADSVAFVKEHFGNEDEVVLVKGSLGMKMKQIVNALEAEE